MLTYSGGTAQTQNVIISEWVPAEQAQDGQLQAHTEMEAGVNFFNIWMEGDQQLHPLPLKNLTSPLY